MLSKSYSIHLYNANIDNICLLGCHEIMCVMGGAFTDMVGLAINAEEQA